MENNQANVEVAVPHPVHQITPLSKYFALCLFIALPFLGGFIGYSYGLKQAVMEPMVLTVPTVGDEVVQPVTSEGGGSRSLEEIFDLANKQPGTELFFSPEWGIGFTYYPLVYSQEPITVETKGSVINLFYDPNYGQTIEVFEKDPSISIEDAIKDRFLQGINPEICFVEAEAKGSYIKAEIAYPMNTDPIMAWFETSYECPGRYSRTNGIQYFLYNPAVPTKYLFVRVGQDSLTHSGDPKIPWSESVQILPQIQ